MTRYPKSRREFLWSCGGGLGGIALAHLLGSEGLLAGEMPRPRAGLNGGLPRWFPGDEFVCPTSDA